MKINRSPLPLWYHASSSTLPRRLLPGDDGASIRCWPGSAELMPGADARAARLGHAVMPPMPPPTTVTRRLIRLEAGAIARRQHVFRAPAEANE